MQINPLVVGNTAVETSQQDAPYERISINSPLRGSIWPCKRSMKGDGHIDSFRHGLPSVVPGRASAGSRHHIGCHTQHGCWSGVGRKFRRLTCDLSLLRIHSAGSGEFTTTRTCGKEMKPLNYTLDIYVTLQWGKKRWRRESLPNI